MSRLRRRGRARRGARSLFLCAVLWLRPARAGVRFMVCPLLQLPLLASGAASHGIFLLVPCPALRCVLNLGRRSADRRRRLGRSPWPAHLGVVMPRYRLGSLLSCWRGGRCRWSSGRWGLSSRWGAPVSLGRLSAPFGVRWALLLHRWGPLWIELRTVTWRGHSQDRRSGCILRACRGEPWEQGRAKCTGRAALPDVGRAFRRLREIQGSGLTQATGARKSAPDQQHPHCCMDV